MSTKPLTCLTHSNAVYHPAPAPCCYTTIALLNRSWSSTLRRAAPRKTSNVIRPPPLQWYCYKPDHINQLHHRVFKSP